MRFINQRLFGRGTWADLYLAERSDTGETVMIKALREGHDASAKRTFLRELRIVTRAIHRRVLRAIFGRADTKRPYYVMPYFPHGPLTPYAGKMTHGQLRAAAQQLFEAIAAMHAQEIIHGDIKPDNMMVAADGNLQVGDPLGNGAGCTVLFAENSGGTPGYWAPEVAAGRGPISKPGDVYSIGATLYHLATGARPIDGNSMDPWIAGAHVPDDVRQIILAACRPTPGARPAVPQLLRALNGNLAALAQPTTPAGQDVGGALLAVGGIVLGAMFLGALFSKAK